MSALYAQLMRKSHMKRAASYLIIFLWGSMIHGLLLFNDGIYWDDWLWVTALKEKNWPVIHAMGFERGIPLDSYFQWFFSGFQNIEFAHRFVAFLCILVSAMLVHAICRQVGVLTWSESLWIALVSMTYPAFQTQIILSTTNYLFYYMLFLGGVLLALKSKARSSFQRYGLRIGALILFFLSFSLASLLVFYFGFLLLLLLFVRRLKSFSLRETLTRFVPRHLDYIFLPFLYWAVKEIMFPQYGLYADYNRFQFSPVTLVLNLGGFLNNAVYFQLNSTLKQLLEQPALGLFIVLAAYQIFPALKLNLRHFFSIKSYWLLGFGVVLFGLGIFPYVIVGQAPASHGWSTRDAILVGLPMALVILGAIGMVFSPDRERLSRPGFVFLLTVAVAFGLITVNNYLSWQARWVKDRSVMVNLGQLAGAEKYSIYWVDDQYPLGGEDNYRFYEWSSMFEQIWGDQTRIGLDQRYSTPKLIEELKPTFTANYNLSDLDPAGCQATLTIRPRASPPPDFELVVRYLYYRFLRPQGMQDFLAGVTRVSVQLLPSLLAINCRQR
jgi:hypothetical protein